MPKILTKDAAQILKKSEVTVTNYEKSGRLKAEKTPGGTRLYERSDVEKLARELEKKQK